MLDQLATLFQAFEKSNTSELEVNISLRTAGHNIVPFQIAHDICTLLSSDKYAQDIDIIPTKHYLDFFYNDHIRVRAQCGQRPIAIQKTQIASISCRCTELRHFSFHFTLRDEIPTELPKMGAVPNYVRMQEVREFIYKQSFIYVIKKVCSGETKQLACQQPPFYELEIEMIRNSEYMKSHSSLELAESLVSKALGFLPRDKYPHLHLELNAMPKTLQLQEPERVKRKYVSKKKRALELEKSQDLQNIQNIQNNNTQNLHNKTSNILKSEYCQDEIPKTQIPVLEEF